MPPRLVPLLYIRGGELAAANAQGEYRPLASDPRAAVQTAQQRFAAADALYVLDVDGVESGATHLNLLQRLEKGQVFPWVDAGCRRVEDVMDVFFAGAEAVTIQLRHMHPQSLRDVAEMAEADLHLGVTLEGTALEKGLTPRNVQAYAEELQATGVVLYEGPRADFHAAETVAFELSRHGLPTAWVALPGSRNTANAKRSERFSTLIAPETPAP